MTLGLITTEQRRDVLQLSELYDVYHKIANSEKIMQNYQLFLSLFSLSLSLSGCWSSIYQANMIVLHCYISSLITLVDVSHNEFLSLHDKHLNEAFLVTTPDMDQWKLSLNLCPPLLSVCPHVEPGIIFMWALTAEGLGRDPCRTSLTVLSFLFLTMLPSISVRGELARRSFSL